MRETFKRRLGAFFSVIYNGGLRSITYNRCGE
jgi:hypothetical protein